MRRHFVLFALAGILISGSTATTVKALGPTPIRVYILAGQSNMVGVGANSALTSQYTAPLDVVQIYASNRPGWKDLAPGFGASTSYIGPELGFGHAMLDGLDGEPILLIKHAVGGTNLAAQWNPDTPGPQYATLLNTVNAAMSSLQGQYLPRYAGFLWMQGEADAQDATMAPEYADNIENFIEQVRIDFGDPNLPFALGRIAPNETYWPVSEGLGELVRNAQAAAAANIDHAYMIDTDDLTMNADNVHYDTAGLLEMGRRFANAMMVDIFTPGDANRDGHVDVSDLGILATNYGAGAESGWTTADFNADGTVDVSDLGILATNYGMVPAAQSVPETGGLILLLGGIMAVTIISSRSR